MSVLPVTIGNPNAFQRAAFRVQFLHPVTLASLGTASDLLQECVIAGGLDEPHTLTLRMSRTESGLTTFLTQFQRRELDTLYIYVDKVGTTARWLFRATNCATAMNEGGGTDFLIEGEEGFTSLSFGGLAYDEVTVLPEAAVNVPDFLEVGSPYVPTIQRRYDFVLADVPLADVLAKALSCYEGPLTFTAGAVPDIIVPLVTVDHESPLSLLRRMESELRVRLVATLAVPVGLSPSTSYTIGFVSVDAPPTPGGGVFTYGHNLKSLNERVLGETRATRWIGRGAPGLNMGDAIWRADLIELSDIFPPNANDEIPEGVADLGANAYAIIRSRDLSAVPVRVLPQPESPKLLDYHWLKNLELRRIGASRNQARVLGGWYIAPRPDGTGRKPGREGEYFIAALLVRRGEIVPLQDKLPDRWDRMVRPALVGIAPLDNSAKRIAHLDYKPMVDRVGVRARVVTTEVSAFENIAPNADAPRTSFPDIFGGWGWSLIGYNEQWSIPRTVDGMSLEEREAQVALLLGPAVPDGCSTYTTTDPLYNRYGEHSLGVILTKGVGPSETDPSARDRGALAMVLDWYREPGKPILNVTAAVHGLVGKVRMLVRSPSHWVAVPVEGIGFMLAPAFDRDSPVYPRQGTITIEPPGQVPGESPTASALDLVRFSADNVPDGPIQILFIPESDEAEFVIDALTVTPTAGEPVEEIIVGGGACHLWMKTSEVAVSELYPEMEYECDAEHLWELSTGAFPSERVIPGQTVQVVHPTITELPPPLGALGSTDAEAAFLASQRPLELVVKSFEQRIDRAGSTGRFVLTSAKRRANADPTNAYARIRTDVKEAVRDKTKSSERDKAATIKPLGIIETDRLIVEIRRPNDTIVRATDGTTQHPRATLSSSGAPLTIEYHDRDPDPAANRPYSGYYIENITNASRRGDAVIITLPGLSGFYAETTQAIALPVSRLGIGARINVLYHNWELHPTIPGVIQHKTLFAIQKPDDTALTGTVMGDPGHPRAWLVSTGVELPVVEVGGVYSVGDGDPWAEGYFPLVTGDTLRIDLPALDGLDGYAQEREILSISPRGFLTDMRDVVAEGALAPLPGQVLQFDGSIWRPGNFGTGPSFYISPTPDIDWSIADTQVFIVPTDGADLTFSNGLPGRHYTLFLQRTSGSGSVTWGNAEWSGGMFPVLTSSFVPIGTARNDQFVFTCLPFERYVGTEAAMGIQVDFEDPTPPSDP